MNSPQRIVQTGEACLLDASLVHERGIEISKLAAFRMCGIRRIDALDHIAKLHLRGFAQLRERIPGAAV
jgi:hypothetical protein